MLLSSARLDSSACRVDLLPELDVSSLLDSISGELLFLDFALRPDTDDLGGLLLSDERPLLVGLVASFDPTFIVTCFDALL